MIEESSTYQNAAVLGHWLGMFTKVKTGKWTPVDVFLEEEPTNRRVADAWYDWYKDALKGEQPRFEAVIPLIETGETPERQRFSMPNPDDQKTWNSKHWVAWALVQLRRNHFQLETGLLHFRQWDKETVWNRMWQLWLRLRMRRVKAGSTEAQKNAAKKGADKDKRQEEARRAATLAAEQERDDRIEKVRAVKQRGVKEAKKLLEKTKPNITKRQETKASFTRARGNLINNQHLLDCIQLLEEGDDITIKDNEFDTITEVLADLADEDDFWEGLAKIHNIYAEPFTARQTPADAKRAFDEKMAGLVEVQKTYVAEVKDRQDMTKEEKEIQVSRLMARHPDMAWYRRIRNVHTLIHNLPELARKHEVQPEIGTDLMGDADVEVEQDKLSSLQESCRAEALENERLDLEAKRITGNLDGVTTASQKLQINDQDQDIRNAARDANRLLTNREYERTDLPGAMKALRLDPDQPLRLPFIRPAGISLKWWQVIWLGRLRSMIVVRTSRPRRMLSSSTV